MSDTHFNTHSRSLPLRKREEESYVVSKPETGTGESHRTTAAEPRKQLIELRLIRWRAAAFAAGSALVLGCAISDHSESLVFECFVGTAPVCILDGAIITVFRDWWMLDRQPTLKQMRFLRRFYRLRHGILGLILLVSVLSAAACFPLVLMHMFTDVINLTVYQIVLLVVALLSLSRNMKPYSDELTKLFRLTTAPRNNYRALMADLVLMDVR